MLVLWCLGKFDSESPLASGLLWSWSTQNILIACQKDDVSSGLLFFQLDSVGFCTFCQRPHWFICSISINKPACQTACSGGHVKLITVNQNHAVKDMLKSQILGKLKILVPKKSHYNALISYYRDDHIISYNNSWQIVPFIHMPEALFSRGLTVCRKIRSVSFSVKWRRRIRWWLYNTHPHSMLWISSGQIQFTTHFFLSSGYLRITASFLKEPSFP